MTLHEEQKMVQQAMNSALSGLREDPWLARRVSAGAKGEKKVRKKISALALVLILILVLAGTACAVFSSRIAEYLGENDWLATHLLNGKVAQIDNRLTVGGVEFTLEEAAFRNDMLYAVGTAKAVDEKDVLMSSLVTGETESYLAREGKAFIEKAKATGGRMLVTEVIPRGICEDDKPWGSADNVGVFSDEPNEDGTQTISFIVDNDGRMIDRGTEYRIRMKVRVWQMDETGNEIPGTEANDTWEICCKPEKLYDLPETEEPEEDDPEEEISLEGLEGWELAVPETYRETGTLPVYVARKTDLKGTELSWFNSSGIREDSTDGESEIRSIQFTDNSQMLLARDWFWYHESKGDGTPCAAELIPDILQEKQTEEWEETEKTERTELTGITLEAARQQAEELLSRLGLENNEYICTRTLDMSLERIRALGARYEAAVAEGTIGAEDGHKPYDYAAIQPEEEGFYLEYRPRKINTAGYYANFYVTGRGIVNASVRNPYILFYERYTPETLISPEETLKEMIRQMILDGRDAEKTLSAIRKVELTYEEAEGKSNETVFAPAWKIWYTDTRWDNYLLNAIYLAEDGQRIWLDYQ